MSHPGQRRRRRCMDLATRCAHTNDRQYPYIGGKVTRTKSIQEAEGGVDWSAALSGQGPRYLQIVRFLERAMAEGRLRPGDRLPPQRDLAGQLHLDLTTVTRAYAEARARDLIHARGALGTYISTPKVELTPVVDLSMNIPPPPASLDFADLLKRGVEQVLTRADANMLMTYHPGGGSKADREAGAIWLAPVLGRVDPARIVTSPGAQAALAALILALTKPGDAIVTESMTYPGLLGASRQLSRRIVVADRDAHGMTPEALESAYRKEGAKVVYLNPTMQNPTASTMPEHRRRDLARVAAKHDIQIIEDDPYWRLADDAPPSLSHWAPGQVHYISTLSKCLTPGLRTAYVVSPDDNARIRFLAALRAATLMSTPLMTSVATQWIHDGSASQLLEGVRNEARVRQQLAEDILTDGNQHWPAGGIHIWYELPDSWTTQAVAIAARMEGLAVTSSDAFAAGSESATAIRISLGGVRDRARLAQALQRLADLIRRGPEFFEPVVI
jgi:DNA-binding transcriptional MocR family regulator